MTQQNPQTPAPITTVEDLAKLVDYSLMDTLTCDPDATSDGDDYSPRQVRSGHYVPVKPTPLAAPAYVAHSATLFKELNFNDALAHTDGFRHLFSGDLSQVPAPMRKAGWATGYALSIYGTEYTQQCPFGTGNGYGDGRAVSILEVVANQQRWEMQLKGGGRTPYCRGADGRAVLRSSIREFLAQEHMHALGVPTSRSLSLFVSQTESVNRPWYSEGSLAHDPDMIMPEPVAISTRVAPSFLRVGQLELFGRRARNNEHPSARQELEQIVLHLIEREYKDAVDTNLPFTEQLVAMAQAFSERLTSLVTQWLCVGFCQGNFNSDNCAAGGFTLDYGPFGFCERFDPYFQPWTGGGQHFSFFNQPVAAAKNFHMFCTALRPLLQNTSNTLEEKALARLEDINQNFLTQIQQKFDAMWAAKLGLKTLNTELFGDLMSLIFKTPTDFTMLFRELSNIPNSIEPLQKSFYSEPAQPLLEQWSQWLERWRSLALADGDKAQLSAQMKRVNPKYTWREWLVVPAYQQARQGDYSLIQELQEVLSNPYDEQSKAIEEKYYQLRPAQYFDAGGVSHYSCSS